jgi:hypothetical protein
MQGRHSILVPPEMWTEPGTGAATGAQSAIHHPGPDFVQGVRRHGQSPPALGLGCITTPMVIGEQYRIIYILFSMSKREYTMTNLL